MKLIGSNKISRKSEYYLEGATLFHCSIVKNDYQQDSRVLQTFVPNKSLGQLLYIPPKNFRLLKTFNLELSRDRR